MTTKNKQTARKGLRSLDERFEFLGDGIAPEDRKALRSSIFEVEDKRSNQQRILKLWKKTGQPVDADLRQLWLHEMRQVQRVMAYAEAKSVIVDIIEFVEDSENFGVVLEQAGQPVWSKILRVSRQHWLKNLGAPRARALLWRNLKRIAVALGIVHSQGLVHGKLNTDSIMTEGAEHPDFKLTGFEWSLWLSADKTDKAYAKLGVKGTEARAEKYSFAEDWRSFGILIAGLLDATIHTSGDAVSLGKADVPIVLTTAERVLVKRLVVPTRMEHLDADSIARAIDDIVSDVGRSVSSRSGTFVLTFTHGSGLSDAVYDITEGEIAVDEYRDQLDWVRGDLDGGATLLIPKRFDGAARLQLVTNTMVYRLSAFRDEGSAVWDIAVCDKVSVRQDTLRRIAEHDEHEIVQAIEIVPSFKSAVESRARLGADVLDWSGLAAGRGATSSSTRIDLIRRSLMLIQVIEAVVKSLDVYPVEIVEQTTANGRRWAAVRPEPDNDRDRIARKVGVTETTNALKRFFQDDHRDSEGKWRFSEATSLGATRFSDVPATFSEVIDRNGIAAYQFEIDAELPADRRLFLRLESDAGTEQVISRRLKNIKALSTRVDLADMLDDPWRVRRSSRNVISDTGQKDKHFQDLDAPKQHALLGLWETLPSYFVVGPPGVGKTRLATEVVRRRFAQDMSTRMLVSAQGHDALDNLQEKIKQTLKESRLDDVIIVRSASERTSHTEDEVNQSGLAYLQRLAESRLTRDVPAALRDRIHALNASSRRLNEARLPVDRETRIALNAVSSLVLDAANVVVSTANSPDIERLVEAHAQFDWVVVEEAAKATGPELVGPMMLSGRRLLIGDHHQLPPFEADRLVKILRDHGLIKEAIQLAEQYVGPLMRDGEIAELELVVRDPEALRDTADMALRLFEPFRTFVEDDDRRKRGSPTHRPISATLTEQRRMDPAIARIVSNAFYNEKLETQKGRAKEAEVHPTSFQVLAPLPQSPVVVINFPHVSMTGSSRPVERGMPRWHNPSEVTSTIEALKCLRPTEGQLPTLAILTFYKAQVDKLNEKIDAEIRSGSLAHLQGFAKVRNSDSWVGTVDGFQGSEADIVLLSFVRNNAAVGTGALGFLRDRRRMNVALSRAKQKLIILGSLSFLTEAVRGVNPDEQTHDLEFLTIMIRTINDLAQTSRIDGVPMASLIPPTLLSGRS